MLPHERNDLHNLVKTAGIDEVLEILAQICREEATAARLRVAMPTMTPESVKASFEDPEYIGWHRAMKRLAVLAKDLRYTYLRYVKGGPATKESSGVPAKGDLHRNIRL